MSQCPGRRGFLVEMKRESQCHAQTNAHVSNPIWRRTGWCRWFRLPPHFSLQGFAAACCLAAWPGSSVLDGAHVHDRLSYRWRLRTGSSAQKHQWISQILKDGAFMTVNKSLICWNLVSDSSIWNFPRMLYLFWCNHGRRRFVVLGVFLITSYWFQLTVSSGVNWSGGCLKK